MRMMGSMPTRQRGFTLAELMVAAVIGLLVAGVAAAVYLSARDGYKYQDATSRLQENARFAMERLSRDIRMAGYSGCGSLTNVANTVNGSSTSWWLNLNVPVTGYEGGASTFPTEFVNPVAGTDAITLLGVDSSSELTVISHNAVAATIQTTQHSIQPGAILVLTDCSQTSIFQMSGPTNTNSNATNVNHNTGNAVTPSNCNKELGASCPTAKAYTFKPGASLMQMYANGYYISPSATAGAGNSLWYCTISGQTAGTPACLELLAGVENMQIEYGYDSDSDMSANYYAKANQVTDWNKVVSVKVSLLLSTSSNEGKLSSKAQTYNYNGASVTATDRSVRQVYTTIVSLRNRVK